MIYIRSRKKVYRLCFTFTKAIISQQHSRFVQTYWTCSRFEQGSSFWLLLWPYCPSHNCTHHLACGNWEYPLSPAAHGPNHPYCIGFPESVIAVSTIKSCLPREAMSCMKFPGLPSQIYFSPSLWNVSVWPSQYGGVDLNWQTGSDSPVSLSLGIHPSAPNCRNLSTTHSQWNTCDPWLRHTTTMLLESCLLIQSFIGFLCNNVFYSFLHWQ